jgi:RNA polymerase sigma-70 factor (ECF subfamily)
VLYARQLCAEPADVVQQAFLKLAEQKAAPRAPIAWLYGVVRNEAKMAARGERRRTHREVAATRGKDRWFALPENDAIDAGMAAEALANLPPEKREIVTLHLWGGLGFREIGELVGASPSTAHRHYHEALATLRKEMSAACKKTT